MVPEIKLHLCFKDWLVVRWKFVINSFWLWDRTNFLYVICFHRLNQCTGRAAELMTFNSLWLDLKYNLFNRICVSRTDLLCDKNLSSIVLDVGTGRTLYMSYASLGSTSLLAGCNVWPRWWNEFPVNVSCLFVFVLDWYLPFNCIFNS